MTLNKILDILLSNQDISVEKIAKMLGWSAGRLDYYLKHLQYSTFNLKFPYTRIYSLKDYFASEIGFKSNFSQAINHYGILFSSIDDSRKFSGDMKRDTFIPLLRFSNNRYSFQDLSNDSIYLTAVFSSQVETGSRGSIYKPQRITIYFPTEELALYVSNLAKNIFKVSNSIYKDTRKENITYRVIIISHLIRYYVDHILDLNSDSGFINLDIYYSLSQEQKTQYVAGILDCHLYFKLTLREGIITNDNENMIQKMKRIIEDYFGFEINFYHNILKHESYSLIISPKRLDLIFKHPISNYFKNMDLILQYEYATNKRKNPEFEKLAFDPSPNQLKIVLNSAYFNDYIHLFLYYSNVEILQLIQTLLKSLGIDSTVYKSKCIRLKQEDVIKARNLNLFSRALEEKFQKMLDYRRSKRIKDSKVIRIGLKEKTSNVLNKK